MTFSHLERLEIIDFIVNETDRECQGDFEEDMLRDQLETMTDIELDVTSESLGWM